MTASPLATGDVESRDDIATTPREAHWPVPLEHDDELAGHEDVTQRGRVVTITAEVL